MWDTTADLDAPYWTQYYALHRKILAGQSTNYWADVRECDRLRQLAEANTRKVKANYALLGVR